MSMTPDASWQRLESLLDGLLLLPPGQREQALVELGREHDNETIEQLRDWLVGIEQSSDFMETAVERSEGRRVGYWRLLSRLGRGGMGEVWLAERADGVFSKQVAIKFIRGDSVRLRERFAQERRIVARLEHPNIARLLDGGVDDDGHPYLVTEYVDGAPLDRWCSEQHADFAARLTLFRQIGNAVAHAHANLVVHRDLKSSNVLVDANGTAKLLDFGIAKLIEDDGGSETMEHALTPECAAPEQISGGPITTRTDVYALGAMLYQLISGRAPLQTRGLPLAELVRRVSSDVPPAPSRVPVHADGVAIGARSADFDAIVLRALAKAPEDRYATVDALLADLDNAVALRPVSARGTAFGYRARRFLRRNLAAVAAGATLALVLSVGLAGTLWQARVAARERDSALFVAERSDAARDFLVRLLSEGRADAPLLPHEMIERATQLLDREPAMRADVRAMMQSVVGELQLERRDYAGAERTFRRLAEGAGNAPDALAIDAMCELGAAQIALDRQAEAQHWLDQGLAQARRLEGSQRASLATCLSYASMRSRDPADRPRSLALGREAVDVIDHLGVRYASRQSALHNNYANVLATANKTPEAITEFRRALALLAEAGRSRSADYSTAEGNLASVLADAGLAHEADTEYTRAIALRREVSGESIGLAQQMSLHASVLIELDRPAEVLSLIDKAAAMLAANADPPGLRLAHIHLRRAGAYALQSRREDAEREFDETERLYATILPPQSQTHNNVALGRAMLWMRTARDRGDLDRAGSEIDKASVLARANRPAGAPLPGSILRSAAELALYRDDAASAQASASAAHARDAADLDARSWQLALDDALLGEAAIRLGHAADGRVRLADAASRLDAALGSEHWRTRQARTWLGKT
jgi:predicted Ser/Thr protein kinase